MSKVIPVIDLFAGPGGLGEGFASLKQDGQPVYKIKLSVEMEKSAHQTLKLRSFFRQFSTRDVPEIYYDYIRGKISRDDLFSNPKYKEQSEHAKNEALLAEMGNSEDDKKIEDRISKISDNTSRWILIGGPPCQAYSVIGRSRNTGIKDYKPEKDSRSYLYKEYLKILARHQPAVFIMENVRGILSSKLEGKFIFNKIIKDLRKPSKYIKNSDNVEYNLYPLSKDTDSSDPGCCHQDFIVNCEKHGIPQTRHRVIIFGIRTDIILQKPILLENKPPVLVKDVIKELPELRSGLSREKDSNDSWKENLRNILGQEWLNNSIRDVRIYERIVEIINNINDVTYNRGAEYIPCKTELIHTPAGWYNDERIGGVCNHTSRSHMVEDLYRYLFASVFSEIHGKSPKLNEFPNKLLPNHRNAVSDKFEDRFRVQSYNQPSTTVVSHIAKDGHYYIHPEPSQCRSLTVREAARLQTFPDNYYFCGNRTQQYVQVGNAVPPYLAYQIAGIVHKILKVS